jgi:hypothetical protein
MLRHAQYAYWRHYETTIEYYIFHHMFEVLYHIDETFRACWDRTPVVETDAPHAFLHARADPYDPARFREILDGCFVHKLTYKGKPEELSGDTMLARLVYSGPSPSSDPLDVRAPAKLLIRSNSPTPPRPRRPDWWADNADHRGDHGDG